MRLDTLLGENSAAATKASLAAEDKISILRGEVEASKRIAENLRGQVDDLDAARADHRRQTGQLVEVLRDMQADARRLGATIERSPRRAGNLAPSYVARSQGRGRRKGEC